MRRPVVAIHQPNYLPWAGWFAKAAQADVMVLLDDVQFAKGSYTNRAWVKARHGDGLLTVPVERGAGHAQRIADVRIADDRRWARRHADVLEQAYHGMSGWSAHGPALREILVSGERSLVSLNEALIALLRAAFRIEARVVRASELGPREEHGNLGNLEIARRVGASTYLSGQGAKKYDDPAPFAAAGVDLVYGVFEHPVYGQPHGPFVAGLSAVDLLFCTGLAAPAILRSGCRDR